MANPKFTLGANELQFSQTIVYPVRKPHEKIQVTDRTAGGTLQVEDLGIDIRRRPLVFNGLPKTDYDNLMNWYDTICDGAMNAFTYTDYEGNDYTVRMLTNPLDFKELPQQLYRGHLLLEIV